MTKSDYLIYRNKGSLEPLYEYYKENYKGKGFFLPPDEFFGHIVTWPPLQDAYNRIMDEYDKKFEISCLRDDNGNVIKYL